MNIVYISHFSGKGGANHELVLLIREMQKKGNAAWVVMPKNGWLYDTLKEECKCIIVPYHRWVEKEGNGYTRLRRMLKWLINWTAALRIKYKLKKTKIDIIHTNDSLTVVGAYLAKSMNIPHIWHMREIFDEQFGFIHTYNERYCAKWISRAKYVVAISNAVYNRYRKYGNIHLKKVYDGVKPPCTNRRNRNGDRLELLFCGGTSIDKGFDDVLELSKRLQHNGVDFRIRIAGTSTIDQALKQDMIKAGIDEKMEFLGFVNNLEEIRQDSDILLMCSRSEAFGLVTVEAMLSGVLVIGKNSGGTPEIICDRKTGFLYNNIDELVDCVLYAIQNDCDGIVQNAKDYATRNFSIESTANKIERLYVEV